MDRIKTKLILEINNRLRSAPESDAKLDLMEELSENLYLRYLDFTAEGMESDEAFARTLDELGDEEELRTLLDEGGEEGWTSDFGRNVDDLVRDAMEAAKQAVQGGKELAREAMAKFKEKFPEGFHGTIRIDGGDKGRVCWDEEEFDEHWGEDEEEWDEDGASFTVPAEHLRGIDIHAAGTDVTIRVGREDEDVEVNCDGSSPDWSVGEDGILRLDFAVMSNSSRGLSFFGGRSVIRFGSLSEEAEIILPRRQWEMVRVHTASGDIRLEDDLDAALLELVSASGDVTVRGCAGAAKLRTASGDIEAAGAFGEVSARCASGDVLLRGSCAGPVACDSSSGDITVDLAGLPERVALKSVSGDCRLRVPDGQGFTLHYSTRSGRVRSAFPMEGDRGCKTYLGGGVSTVQIQTTSGDITIGRK